MSERNANFKDITTFCHFIKVVKKIGTNTIITQKFNNESVKDLKMELFAMNLWPKMAFHTKWYFLKRLGY